MSDRRWAAGLVAVAITTAGCGSSAPAAGGPRPDSQAVSDCAGHQTTVGTPPTRVVTLTASVLEMLFWLGVGDRVIGTGVPPRPGTFPPEFDAAAQRIPKLAGGYSAGSYKPVPKEQLLAAGPDLVVGGFPSNFAADGATGQDELAAAGVPSYLAFSTACATSLSAPQTDLDLVYRDLTNLGRIFGVPDRADALAARMRATIADVHAKIAGVGTPSVFAFEYDEGTQTPYAPSNRQTINAVITQAGGRNIVGDIDKAYEKVAWEQVASRNPDVILLIIYDKGDAAANSAGFAAAETFVRTFAPLAGVTAVRQGRYARLIYEHGSVGGVRNADAVADLAKQLHPDQVP